MKKSLLVIMVLMHSYGYADNKDDQLLEDARARSEIRRNLDWNRLEIEEENKAKEEIKNGLNRNRLQITAENEVKDQIRNSLNHDYLRQEAERKATEEQRQIARNRVDENKIFDEEYAKISQEVFRNRLQPYQIQEIRNKIYTEEHARIQREEEGKIRTTAQRNAENNYYQVAYNEHVEIVKDNARKDVHNRDYESIKQKAQASEKIKIENEEKDRFRTEMSAAIRKGISDMINNGEIEVLTDYEKRSIEEKEKQKQHDVQKENHRHKTELKYQKEDLLDDSTKQEINKRALENAISNFAAQKARQLERWNWMIRTWNFFQLLPFMYIDEYSVEKESDHIATAEFNGSPQSMIESIKNKVYSWVPYLATLGIAFAGGIYVANR